jgi:hypothetical protein
VIESARAVADAVLYEGFLLFPYSKHTLKNQLPFQFGVLMPVGYADVSEPTSMRAQFIALPGRSEGEATIAGLLRFLQIRAEPVEREIPFDFTLENGRIEKPFAIDTLQGTILVQTECADGICRVTLEVRNETTTTGSADRNEALRGALVSAHAVLQARNAEFTSLMDPPPQATAAAARCVNERVFPVLLGESGEGTQTSPLLLVSPIILYDFPRIAKASRTRTFDGTEIDELLMLSVASLSEQEKADARAAHPYVRELVERAGALDAETLHTLHGELTGGAKVPGDESVEISGVTVSRGSHVRVLPKGRADVWDDVVRGMTARVNAVHTDFEGKRYIGVVFDNDPAGEIHDWYGRSFFYGADEVEPLS